jgi:acetolactate synthase-1/2/3 large subunit
MLGSLSKAVHRAETSDAIASVVASAISQALSAPRGPVSVELPIDLQYDEATPVPDAEVARILAPAEVPLPDPVDLSRAIELVQASCRPLVWAGGGVVSSGAEADVAELVHRLGAGLLTSPNGRGVLSEDDPSCIGNLSWDPDVRALCADADVLVAVGTRYQGPNTENWKMPLPGTIVQIDVVPERSALNYEATVAVRGDAAAVVRAMLAGLDDERLGLEEGWPERVAGAAGAARSRLRHVIGAQEGLLDELSTAIGPDVVVVKDATIPAYTWGNRLLPVVRSRAAVMPNGFAIGLGIAHALGAGAAAVMAAGTGHAHPVVLMAGDGGVMLAISELATLAAEQLPVVVIVFCDGGYGILRNIQDKQYGEDDGRIGVELGAPDFVALAGALGVGGTRVSTTAEFGKAVREALRGPGPHLVEVDLNAIGPMSRPYTGTSRPPKGLTTAN